MDGFLVAGHGNPEVKNITQKDQVVVGFFKGFQHLEKGGVVFSGFADMGIGNNDHRICSVWGS